MGLSERAIRHYEAKGLIAPARSPSGQRHYGTEDVMGLAHIALLRRAGFSLEDIRKLMKTSTDAQTIVAAHLASLRTNRDAITQTIEKLEIVADRLGSGAPSDSALICEILQIAEHCYDGARWRAVLSRYFSPDQAEDWMVMRTKLQEKVDPQQYDKDWRELIDRIKAELPLNPASRTAQRLLDEWDALLAPFRKVATKEQQRLAKTMWSNAGAWTEKVAHPMTQEVADFISAARREKGEQFETPLEN